MRVNVPVILRQRTTLPLQRENERKRVLIFFTDWTLPLSLTSSSGTLAGSFMINVRVVSAEWLGWFDQYNNIVLVIRATQLHGDCLEQPGLGWVVTQSGDKELHSPPLALISHH